MTGLPFFRREPPKLTGNQVVLRVPRRSDFSDWAALRQESRSFLEPWEPRWAPDELDRASWRHRLGRYRSEQSAGTAIAYFIFHKKSGALLGGITIGNIRYGVSQSAQIGYWMGERHAGQGHMFGALNLAIPYIFSSLQLHRIEAACIPDNTRSIRLLEKVGFRQEGYLREYLKINGEWRDHVMFSLLAADRQS